MSPCLAVTQGDCLVVLPFCNFVAVKTILQNTARSTAIHSHDKYFTSVNYNFSAGHQIKFRDAKDLKKILKSHTVAPHEPGVMCTGAAPSILLYVDESKTPREVHWLDLSGSKPKPAAGKCIIHTQQTEIYDMCFVDYGDKQLLIVAADDEGLFAYNTRTDKLEWKVVGKQSEMEENMLVTGVATDGRGHLFVADDGNKCIRMFSVSDHSHVKCLVKGVETIGNPDFVRWCEKTSSLLCLYCRAGKWHIKGHKVIKVQF